MSEVEKHVMPNGDTCWYRDSNHEYNESPEFKRNARLAGWSTVSKNSGDTNTDPLIDWGSKLTCEGVARELAPPIGDTRVPSTFDRPEWLETGDLIWSRLKERKRTWRAIREEASSRGNVSHRVLENLAEGVTPICATGYDRAVVQWWKDRRPEAVLTEQVVYSKTHKVAGRFDLLAGLDVPTLVDLKTSSYISGSFAVQLHGDALTMEEAGFEPPEKLIVLQVFENGDYLEVEMPINPKWALTALATYQSGKEIRSAVGKAKKAAEAAFAGAAA
jgi:hypothetical protein